MYLSTKMMIAFGILSLFMVIGMGVAQTWIPLFGGFEFISFIALMFALAKEGQ